MKDVPHDIVVIGGSAGALEVLLEMAGALPPDLPATIFVALHTVPDSGSRLAELLSQRGPLPATQPLHGQAFEPGRIYVAPPDNHLLVRRGTMEVVRGPRENGHRPAVDALFRSAARAYGPRVAAVVLSGYQDCGTAGLLSVKARGGAALVQDPDTASVAEMPQSALDQVAVDAVVAPADLGAAVASFARRPHVTEAAVDEGVSALEGDAKGAPTSLVCPQCQGALTRAKTARFTQYRCHVGHTFSQATLEREQDEALERALWASVRALEDTATLQAKLGEAASGELRRRHAEKAQTSTEQARLIRRVLLGPEAAG